MIPSTVGNGLLFFGNPDVPRDMVLGLRWCADANNYVTADEGEEITAVALHPETLQRLIWCHRRPSSERS